jgi:hypothetical protein
MVSKLPPLTDRSVRKVTAADLQVGLICADRDGNRIRIDSVDRAAGRLSYHFLNDELRVQEGIQNPAIEAFIFQGWYLTG